MTFEDAIANLEEAISKLESYYGSGFRVHPHSYQELCETLPRLERICGKFLERREEL